MTETYIPNNSQDKLISRGLKFNHLRLIAALGETGQISASAALLHMAQPSASRLLSELEYIVGNKLYSRHPRGIILNESGLLLAKKARHMLRGLDDMNRQIIETGEGLRGAVSVGAVTTPALEIILPIIRHARVTHPNIEISVTVDTSPKMAESMLNGNIDFYIGRITEEIDPRPFRTRIIGKEPLVLIVRSDHPLTRDAPKDLSDCTSYDWVLQSSGELMRHAVEKYFAEHGYKMPTQILNTSSVMMTLAIISQSNSIAPVSHPIADFYGDREDGTPGRIARLPIAKDLYVTDYSLISSADRSLSPASEAIFDLVNNRLDVDRTSEIKD
ncbi:MAG: LysR family transcriptional regulator [Alphaproteobacteria bacterium]|nr:LysR family transcriptional regulator [Alphaproteobacteria bacterium]